MTSRTILFSHRGREAARNGITHSCVLTSASCLPTCMETHTIGRVQRSGSGTGVVHGVLGNISPYIVCQKIWDNSEWASQHLYFVLCYAHHHHDGLLASHFSSFCCWNKDWPTDNSLVSISQTPCPLVCPDSPTSTPSQILLSTLPSSPGVRLVPYSSQCSSQLLQRVWPVTLPPPTKLVQSTHLHP